MTFVRTIININRAIKADRKARRHEEERALIAMHCDAPRRCSSENC